MRHPDVYLYKISGNRFELYLGGFSTAEGAGLFEKTNRIRLLDFGATGYQRYGWATEKEIPVLENIGELISFLEKETHLGLVTFEAEITGEGSLSSHDDTGCHLILNSRQQLFSFIKQVAPPVYRDKLLAALIQNPEMYLTIDEFGIIRKFNTFSQYLQAKPR